MHPTSWTTRAGALLRLSRPWSAWKSRRRQASRHPKRSVVTAGISTAKCTRKICEPSGIKEKPRHTKAGRLCNPSSSLPNGHPLHRFAPPHVMSLRPACLRCIVLGIHRHTEPVLERILESSCCNSPALLLVTRFWRPASCTSTATTQNDRTTEADHQIAGNLQHIGRKISRSTRPKLVLLPYQHVRWSQGNPENLTRKRWS